jgi:surface antigen
MTTLKNFKDKGIVVSKKPEVGAIVIWSKGNWKGHTGIVSDITALEAQGTFFTIEGNTSYASDSNGDKVMVRKRYLKDSPSFKIAGFINPKDIIDYVTTNNKSTV